MNTLKIVVVTLAVFLVAGCAATQTPQLTPLGIQSLQTRDYEHPKDIVFPSVLSVFQDLGYIVQTAEKDTGFITAESPAGDASGFWEILADMKVSSHTAATASIEQIGQITRVRLNLVVKKSKSSLYGQASKKDTPILDAQIYQNAFEKIESAIFVRSAN